MTTDGSAVAERPIASSEPVLYEVSESGVAVITLNRPERRNAWGGGMTDRFFRYVETAEADSNVRVILLTGSGGAFCVGADMGDLDSISSTTIESAGKTDVRSLVAEKHPYFLTRLRKPVITAINGSVAGIGLSLALMSDVRFAAAGAKFTTSFARRGLVAEYGISWILPRLVGWGAAIDLLLSGRTFLAEEALELGLVKEVVPGEVAGSRPVLRRGHRPQLRAQLAGGDETAALRRRRAADRADQREGRAADARIDDPQRFHRGHHRVLPEACAELSISDRPEDRRQPRRSQPRRLEIAD